WIEANATNLLDDPSVAGIVLNFHDITARRHAEEALKSVETHKRALIEHRWDAIVLADPCGVIQYLSPAASRILSYQPEELVGRNGFELMRPDDVPLIRARLAQLLQMPGGTLSSSYRYRHKDGSWVWMDATGTNLLDDPSVGGIVLNYHDVTARRRAE